MPILNIQTTQAGLTGVLPSIAYIQTSDTEAAVLVTGYLNQTVQSGLAAFSLPCIACVSTIASAGAAPVSGWYNVSYAPNAGVPQQGNWSLTATAAPGTVVLPTIANHIATYTNTSGTLSEDPAIAISSGSIQAGLSGAAGTLISYPSTASKGSFVIAGVANTGNTNTTLSNVAMGQASVVSIPDPANAVGHLLIGATATPFVSGNFPQNSGTAGLMVDSGIPVSSLALTANVVLLTPAADQTITVHNLTIAQGNLAAGSSGHAGTVASFPATAANGSLILAGVASGGAFNTTISNGTMGQSTVYTMGDIGATTGGLVVATTAVRMKAVAAAAAAGGAATQSFTDTFCTTGSVVVGNWVTQTTPAEIITIAPGNGSFVVTSTGNAGAGTFSYVIYK